MTQDSVSPTFQLTSQHCFDVFNFLVEPGKYRVRIEFDELPLHEEVIVWEEPNQGRGSTLSGSGIIGMTLLVVAKMIA